MKSIIIKGGTDFIGVNADHRFGKTGWQVTVLENLSIMRAAINLKWGYLSAFLSAATHLPSRRQ